MIALLELLDRDGSVRQSYPVAAWPLSIGRALGNDVVVTDPHVAPVHLLIEETQAGLAMRVGDTRNGAVWRGKRLRSGESRVLVAAPLAVEATADDGPAAVSPAVVSPAALSPAVPTPDAEFEIGRTHLRLRFADGALPAEVPTHPTGSFMRRAAPLALAAILLLISVLFGTWLGAEPDTVGRTAGAAVLSSVVGAAIWCGLWALLSKTFTRQARFGWHATVFLYSALALAIVTALPSLLAFMFSWPWISDFAFVGEIAVIAAALYFHLLAVEPRRRRVLKWVAVVCGVVGVSLTLWFNVQRTDLFGDELYMNHLYPPALRLARPVPSDAFIDGLTPLKAALDKKAKEPGAGAGDDAARGEDEE